MFINFISFLNIIFLLFLVFNIRNIIMFLNGRICIFFLGILVIVVILFLLNIMIFLILLLCSERNCFLKFFWVILEFVIYLGEIINIGGLDRFLLVIIE